MKTKCPNCNYIATEHETLDKKKNPRTNGNHTPDKPMLTNHDNHTGVSCQGNILKTKLKRKEAKKE